MRLAVLATSEVGSRCARILSAEADLEALGLVDSQVPSDAEGRIRPVADLAHWDLLVSDDTGRAAASASRAGIPLVVPTDGDHARLAGLGVPVLAGCNLRAGVGAALADHAAGRTGEPLDALLAWTEEGSPRRRGEAVPFPDPVGPRWALPAAPGPWLPRREMRLLRAPLRGEWAAVTARVVSAVLDEGVIARTVGVSDHRAHLEAIALAGGGLTLAALSLSPGLHWPAEHGSLYLEKVLRVGLEVASFTERQAARRR